MNKCLIWIGAVGVAVILGACGGGGSSAGTGLTPSPTPNAGGSTCSGGQRSTFSAGSSVTDPFKNGDQVCFTTLSTSTLAFNGKTLTSPTQNSEVTAPYSAWKFVDGAYTYEVIFNGSAPYEINVSKNSSFVGQFAFASAPV